MVSFYDISLPIYINAVGRTAWILKKGKEFAAEKGVSEAEAMEWRLAPDMLPLPFQVQSVCNGAKNFLTRGAGLDLPSVEDNEKTWAELEARLEKTLEMLNAVKPGDLEGKETSKITMKIRDNEITLSAMDYLQKFAIPNLYFHVTTLYSIFRNKGASVGKGDFLRGGLTKIGE